MISSNSYAAFHKKGVKDRLPFNIMALETVFKDHSSPKLEKLDKLSHSKRIKYRIIGNSYDCWFIILMPKVGGRRVTFVLLRKKPDLITSSKMNSKKIYLRPLLSGKAKFLVNFNKLSWISEGAFTQTLQWSSRIIAKLTSKRTWRLPSTTMLHI